MGAGSAPRFGTDGVRGVAYTELSTEFVRTLGRAVARVIGSPVVLVGRDTRASSPELAAAVGQGLALEGVRAVSVGVLPTPALAWLAASEGAAAVMVTASHNPYTDNGVKVFAAGGTKLTDGTESAIESELERLGVGASDGVRSSAALAETAVELPGAVERYAQHFVDLFGVHALEGMHLVVDCAHGAMSQVAPDVLRRLGARLTVIGAEPDGTNINAGCGATHPGRLLETVRSLGADAGLAFDGDGDRVIAATARTGIIDGDRILAVIAPWLRETGSLAGDALAVTVMSNLGLRRAMDEAGIRVVETAVGDRYVLEALEREQLCLGGEQSGHIILRHLATTGDGLLAGIVLLTAARSRNRSLDEVAGAAMSSFPQVLVNVRIDRPDPSVVAGIAPEIAAVASELGDSGRVLVRPSGTEPVVRVMVEAADSATAERSAQRLADAIARRLSGQS